MGKSKKKGGTSSRGFHELQGQVDGLGEDLLEIESMCTPLPRKTRPVDLWSAILRRQRVQKEEEELF